MKHLVLLNKFKNNIIMIKQQKCEKMLKSRQIQINCKLIKIFHFPKKFKNYKKGGETMNIFINVK